MSNSSRLNLALHCSRTLFDVDGKSERLEEVDRELSLPETWEDQEKVKELSQERSRLDRTVGSVLELRQALVDASEYLELAAEESDQDALDELADDFDTTEQKLGELEFQRMFDGETDSSNAFIDIQFGEGGTEAQDWANMLLRMYIKWCEKRQFGYQLREASPGDIAGIRSATLYVAGEFAFGWLRTETGIHRLVRHSPFDSGNRRHTSFASVYVYAEVDDTIEIEIDPSDVRTDTYRASGAGGQHVNRTDSAVRLTHLPTKTVVQCQSERSQHQNRDQAWKQLRARLYDLAIQERDAARQELESSKANIGFGSQIRSYVLDQSRVKDLRTNIEISDPTRVLNGDLDEFMTANLKADV